MVMHFFEYPTFSVTTGKPDNIFDWVDVESRYYPLIRKVIVVKNHKIKNKNQLGIKFGGRLACNYNNEKFTVYGRFKPYRFSSVYACGHNFIVLLGVFQK